MWFGGNARLEQCLILDPAHVQEGDNGDHVTLVQGALFMLDGANISNDEQIQQSYGDSTANAVLEYKTERNIINWVYETTPDNIVGRMTMQSLDTEMLAYEFTNFHLLLSFGVPSPPRGFVISQSDPTPAAWARRVQEANSFLTNRPSPVNVRPEDIVSFLKQTISDAGNGGLLIFAVGHGSITPGYPAMGAFDLADNAAMRIGGKGSNRDPAVFQDVFYADPDFPRSEKENDEDTHPDGWQGRLDRWSMYQDLSNTFANGGLAMVVLLTCRIGSSTDFLKKVASQWKTPILAYKDFVWYEGLYPHARAVLQKDIGRPGVGTNVPFSEISIPISPPDMVVVSPS
jgi:hypothetical protein